MLKVFSSKKFPYVFLIFFSICLYYKFFVFGKIPFPGDLLVTSYLPWLDYYKFPTQNPLISDIFSQFFIWKYLSIESFQNFSWPLWNPYSFTGTPLLATYHSATLYPLNILLFIPNYFGWGFFIFSSTLIACINMYIFLSFIPSKISRVLGSIIYSTSGLMTTWLEFGTAVHAMAWLPLSFYCVLKYQQTEKFRFLLLLLVTLVLIILAGNAQVTTYSFILVTIFSMIFFWGRKIIPIFITLILAICIATPQLLPSFELLQKSIRQNDQYTSDFNFGLLPGREVFRFFVADYFGNPVTRNYWGFLNYSETSGFIGTLSLPLLIFAVLFLKKSKIANFFIGCLIFSLIFLFDNFISHNIYQLNIPLLTSSYATRILFLITLSVSILCALSLNQIIYSKDYKKFIRVSIWSSAIILGILAGTFVTTQMIKNITDNSPSILKDFYQSQSDYSLLNLKVSLRNLILPTVISLLFTLILIFFVNFKNRKIYFITLLLLILISIDLGRYFLKFNTFTERDYAFPTTPSLEFLKSQPGQFRVGREHAEVLPPNTWAAYKLQSFEGYDPIYLNNFSSFMHFLNGGNITNASSSRYAELSENYKSPYLDASNVRFFIGILRNKEGNIGGDISNSRFTEAKYPIAFKDKNTVIFSNPNAKERVYFAKSFQNASINETKSLINKGINPTETVILSKNLDISTVTGEGSAKILIYQANLVEIETNTNNEEILVLADQFEDGWHAKVDNEQVLISPANLIFRAIKVPSGIHQVSFYYWPKSFEIGLKIAGVSTLLLMLVLIITIKKKSF